MTGIDLSSLAINWMAAYGAPMLTGMLYLGGLGLPLPSTFIVIAAGAFIRQNLLDATSIPLLGYLGTIAGDASLYLIGHFASGWLNQRFGQTTPWKNAALTPRSIAKLWRILPSFSPSNSPTTVTCTTSLQSALRTATPSGRPCSQPA